MDEKLNFKERNIETPHQEKLRLYKELLESKETFTFSGIDPEWYQRMKKGDEEDEYGFTTPTDILIERFTKHGFRLVQGGGPESGNVFILPNDSTDIVKDTILIEKLNLDTAEDSRIRRLIELCR